MLFFPFLAQPDSVLFSPHSDFVTVHFPARFMFSHSLQTYGRLPLWSPFQFLGSPQLGDWHCQWFYPFTWCYAFVAPLKTLRMMGLQTVFHLILAGLGMYHYLQEQGCSRPARLLGSLIFMLNGKWIAHLLVAQHPILGWAWLPWVMRAMDRLQKQPTAVNTASLVLLLALLMLGSIPPFIAICVYFLAAYGCLLLASSQRPKRLLFCLLSACIWSGAICSSTIWPAVEFAQLCTRGSGLNLAEASQGQIPSQILPCLPTWPTSPLSVGWEMTLYCGAIPCWLAAMSLLRKPTPREGFFLATCAVCLLLALGQQTPLFPLCIQYLPGFSLFRYPARYCLLLGLAVAILAAHQLDQRRPIRGPALLLGLGLCLGLALYGQQQFGRVEGWWSLAWIGLASVATFFPWLRNLLVCLTALELGLFTFLLIDPRTFSEVLKPHLLAEQLKQPQGRGRILSSQSRMLTLPYATMNGVESANGLTALVPKVTLDYLQQAVCQVHPDVQGVLTGIPLLVPRSINYLRRGNISFVLSENALPLGWPAQRTPPFQSYDFLEANGILQFPPLILYRDSNPLPRYRLVRQALRADSSQSAVELANQQDPKEVVVIEAEVKPASPQGTEVAWVYPNYQSRDIEVEVTGQGAYLVLSEPYYPGWKLRSEKGQIKLLRADGYFMAAFLEAGKHRLHLEYAPTSFPICLLVSALSLGLAVGLLGLNRTFKSRNAMP
jgi:hypothetical protein